MSQSAMTPPAWIQELKDTRVMYLGFMFGDDVAFKVIERKDEFKDDKIEADYHRRHG